MSYTPQAVGSYTPTVTGVTNIDSVTAAVTMYMSIGDVVHVAGKVVVDPTASSALTEFRMSLPITTNLTAITQLAGSGSRIAGSSSSYSIRGTAATDDATFRGRTTTLASHDLFFNFSYRVL